MDLFGMSNFDNYEDRKVANTTVIANGKSAEIDTCRVMDTSQPYETGVHHPDYNENKWIIVEQYDTEYAAQVGHDKWVGIMENPPIELVDVSDSSAALLANAFGAENTFKRKES